MSDDAGAEVGGGGTRGQKPLAVRSSDYVELGGVPVVRAPDGGVMIGGGSPPPAALGLDEDNLVCIATDTRPQCSHYTAILTEAEGYTKGVEEQPRQIRRFCRRLSPAMEMMEIGEAAIFACTAREPVDIVSLERILAFERRQRAATAEQNQKRDEFVL